MRPRYSLNGLGRFSQSSARALARTLSKVCLVASWKRRAAEMSQLPTVEPDDQSVRSVPLSEARQVKSAPIPPAGAWLGEGFERIGFDAGREFG